VAQGILSAAQHTSSKEEIADDTISFVCSDGTIEKKMTRNDFTTSHFVQKSGLLSTMFNSLNINSIDNTFNLPNISTDQLQIIWDLLSPEKREKKSAVDLLTLAKIIHAADFLDMPTILDTKIEEFVDLSGNTPIEQLSKLESALGNCNNNADKVTGPELFSDYLNTDLQDDIKKKLMSSISKRPPYREKKELRGHTDAVYSVDWHQDGKLLATAGADKTIKLWDAQTGKSTSTLTGHAAKITFVSWLNDSSLLTGSSDGAIKKWDTKIGKSEDIASILDQKNSSFYPLHMALSPDKKKCTASGNSTVAIIDIESKKTIMESKDDDTDETPWQTAWDPSSSQVAMIKPIGNELATVQLGKTQDVQEDVIKLDSYYTSIAWSPDGKSIAIGSNVTGLSLSGPSHIKILNRQTAKFDKTITGLDGAVRALSWDPKNALLAAGTDTKALMI
jgi:WD40 repeat protein